MKKLLALCLALMMSISAVTAFGETGTGTAHGFAGDVTVNLTITDGVMTGVEISGDAETPGIGGAAMDTLAAEMVKKNSIHVDAVAGATLTSTGVLAAAADALAQAGVELADVATENAGEIETDVSCDILVIGGGGAGIAAAMAANEAGKNVVLIEKLAVFGGNTALSGGVFTRGAIEGDPEGTMTADELFDFYMTATHGLANPAVVRTYVDRAADTLAWAHAMGSGVKGTQRFLTNPENIMAVQAVGSGSGLMTPMIEGVMDSNVDVRPQTSATELIVENGKVCGAKAVTADGIEITFHAGAVVLATGGFPANPELLEKYSSLGAERAYTLCSPGTVGDGLIMAEAIGADVQFGPNWDNIGSNSQLTGAYITAFPQIYSLLVNDKAERFINEDAQRPELYQTMLFQIADGANGFYFMFDSNTIGSGAEAFIEQGECVKADTIEELADLMGVPKDALVATVERYNANKDAEDPDFNKQSKYMAGITEAPFYAVKTWPLRTSTIGGLVIDENAQVLDAQGNVIEGLFAAGEVANYSFFYNVYATCGSAVGHAITFGRIAGENASAYVQ